MAFWNESSSFAQWYFLTKILKICSMAYRSLSSFNITESLQLKSLLKQLLFVLWGSHLLEWEAKRCRTSFSTTFSLLIDSFLSFPEGCRSSWNRKGARGNMWHAKTLPARFIQIASDLFCVGRNLYCLTDQKWPQYTGIFATFIF